MNMLPKDFVVLTGKCPECGRYVDTDRKRLFCPCCGTEPFKDKKPVPNKKEPK